LAALAVIASGVGLWAALAGEARCWGPEAAGIPQGGRWFLIPLFATPHLIGLAAAAASRRSLSCAALVLLGAAANAGLSATVWGNDNLTRTERALGSLQTWALQLLICGVIVGAGYTALAERRRRPEQVESPAAPDRGE
jgi:hypothetical protein